MFAQVLSDLRIPYTRVPMEIGLHSCPWLPAHLQRFYTQVEKDAHDSMPVFARYGIRSVALFVLRKKRIRLKKIGFSGLVMCLELIEASVKVFNDSYLYIRKYI